MQSSNKKHSPVGPLEEPIALPFPLLHHLISNNEAIQAVSLTVLNSNSNSAWSINQNWTNNSEVTNKKKWCAWKRSYSTCGNNLSYIRIHTR